MQAQVTDVQSVVLTQVVVSAMAAWALRLLKRAKQVPWVTTETKRLNQLLALIVAALTAAGMHFEFDRTAGTLVITGLTMSAIAHFVWHTAQSFVMQELVRAGVLEKPALVAVPLPTPAPAVAAAAAGQ